MGGKHFLNDNTILIIPIEICSKMNENDVFTRKCYLDEDLLGINWSIIQGMIEEENTDIIGKKLLYFYKLKSKK